MAENQSSLTQTESLPQDVDYRAEKLGLGAFIFGLIVVISSILISAYGNSLVLQIAAVAGTVTVITSILAILRARFFRRKVQERLDLREQQQQRTSQELFEEADEAVRLAERTEQVYVNVVVRVMTLVLGGVVILLSFLLWRRWSLMPAYPPAEEPLTAAVLALTVALACTIIATYYVGVSRERNCRWLRPCGAWMAFSGIVLFLGVIVLLAQHVGWEITRFDVRMARFAAVLLGLLGLELVFKFISDFYRPRRRGEEEIPLYESRVLGIFTEPGGVARNVAAALDYQFGFKVSDVWFYRFVEKTLLPLLVVAGVFFWLQTCIVTIDPQEEGIRERFGSVVSKEPLTSGFYAKLPWPFSTIRTFPVHRVQKVPVGYEGEEGVVAETDEGKPQRNEDSRIILWDEKHREGETHFVVPTEAEERSMDLADVTGAGQEVSMPVSVYFMTVMVPVYFKVDDLYNYFYRHEDTRVTLRELTSREITRYMAHADYFGLLTETREDAAQTIRKRVQDRADRLEMGVEIVFLGLQGLHPPVEVGDTFNDVVSALERQHTSELEAERYSIEKEPEASAEATEITSEAEAYKTEQLQKAEAESKRFEKRLSAYDASPDIYVLRTFLDLLEKRTEDSRLLLMATDPAFEVNVLNLEKEVDPDLLDLELENGGGP